MKVNAVIIRGFNDGEVESLAAFGWKKCVATRFIEFMPLNSRKAWQRERVICGAEILRRLRTQYELVPLEQAGPVETARRWGFADGAGEIGIIAPVTEPFSGRCNRLRLTSDGRIRTCLFSVAGHDSRALLRGREPDEVIAQFICQTVQHKEERTHIGEAGYVAPDRPMNCIGG